MKLPTWSVVSFMASCDNSEWFEPHTACVSCNVWDVEANTWIYKTIQLFVQWCGWFITGIPRNSLSVVKFWSWYLCWSHGQLTQLTSTLCLGTSQDWYCVGNNSGLQGWSIRVNRLPLLSDETLPKDNCNILQFLWYYITNTVYVFYSIHLFYWLI